MKKLFYIIFGFSSFIFFISLMVFYFNTKTLQTQTFYASVNVSDEIIGFDLNNTALTFGSIGKEKSSTRSIRIENGYAFPIVAILNAKGEIAPLLNYDNAVKIDSGDKRVISLSAFTPSNLTEGFYSGEIEISLYPAEKG